MDSLALTPITIMFAADQMGARYHDYATDHRMLAEVQPRSAFGVQVTISLFQGMDRKDWLHNALTLIPARPPAGGLHSYR